MGLKKIIESEIKQAMLNKDKNRLRALRAIKAQILLAKTEKGVKTELSEAIEMKILTKEAKQRRDSIEIFEKQGREDLAMKEKSELSVIESFLPKQLNEKEVEAEIRQVIDEIGATSSKDMGKVIGAATKKMIGKADGKTISLLVKKLLN